MTTRRPTRPSWQRVGQTLAACKAVVRFFFDNRDQLLNAMRSGEVVAAMMWDTGGWDLNRENPDMHYIVPASGALGWLDTFALPYKGRNDAGAYKWINFTMRPEIAARITRKVGNWTAARGTEELVDPVMRAQFNASFPQGVFTGIKWYPAIPPGLEAMEGRILDRVKAAELSVPASQATPDLLVQSVVKNFAGHRAVNDLSFSVSRGSFFSILGPSGLRQDHPATHDRRVQRAR